MKWIIFFLLFLGNTHQSAHINMCLKARHHRLQNQWSTRTYEPQLFVHASITDICSSGNTRIHTAQPQEVSCMHFVLSTFAHFVSDTGSLLPRVQLVQVVSLAQCIKACTPTHAQSQCLLGSLWSCRFPSRERSCNLDTASCQEQQHQSSPSREELMFKHWSSIHTHPKALLCFFYWFSSSQWFHLMQAIVRESIKGTSFIHTHPWNHKAYLVSYLIP